MSAPSLTAQTVIEFLRTLAPNGQPQVSQRLITPSVYLDTWAIVDISENAVLRDRFGSALAKADGTLVFSSLNFADFAGMADRRHTAAAGKFLDSIVPRIFFSHFDPFRVTSRELDLMAGKTRGSPAGDEGLLSMFATLVAKYPRASIMSEYFGSVYTHRAQVTGFRNDMATGFYTGRDALRLRIESEPEIRSELKRGLANANRPRATLALLRALVADWMADEMVPDTPNNVIDLLHCVVPAAYCTYVLLDAQWDDRLRRAAKRITEAGVTARVATSFTKKDGGMLRFIEALERGPTCLEAPDRAHPRR